MKLAELVLKLKKQLNGMDAQERQVFVRKMLEPIRLHLDGTKEDGRWLWRIRDENCELVGLTIDYKYGISVGWESLTDLVKEICFVTNFFVSADLPRTEIGNPYLGCRSMEEILIRKDLI